MKRVSFIDCSVRAHAEAGQKETTVEEMHQMGLPVGDLGDVDEASCVENESFEASNLTYDASKIDIERRSQTVYGIMERIRNDEIDLFPAFQRSPEVWKEDRQSRLIESLILNIPLPVFYMTEDAHGEGFRFVWRVVDGLQRLCAMRDFVLGNKGHYLRLKGLEYLRTCEGKTFAELPPSFRRNIQEAELLIYLIKPNTPDELKFNIFRRVNTGGVPLNQQEIRHAMHQKGAARFLEELANLEEFKEATFRAIPSTRMVDREFANRFLAFYLKNRLPSYKDMDSFLNAALIYVDGSHLAERNEIEEHFRQALVCLHNALGECAFRRFDPRTGKMNRALNKALFEAFAVTAAHRPDSAIRMAEQPTKAIAEYRKLFADESDQGLGFISSHSTGHVHNITLRHEITRRFFDLF